MIGQLLLGDCAERLAGAQAPGNCSFVGVVDPSLFTRQDFQAIERFGSRQYGLPPN